MRKSFFFFFDLDWDHAGQDRELWWTDGSWSRAKGICRERGAKIKWFVGLYVHLLRDGTYLAFVGMNKQNGFSPKYSVISLVWMIEYYNWFLNLEMNVFLSFVYLLRYTPVSHSSKMKSFALYGWLLQ